MIKKYAACAVLGGALLSLALVAPAFADTNAGQSSHKDQNTHQGEWNGPTMGWRNMQVGPGIFGSVTAINGTTLTVNGRAFPTSGQNGSTTPQMRMQLQSVTYTVDASHATVTKGNATSTVSAIAVGDKIFVQGTINGTNVTATTIRDGVMPMTRPGHGPAPSFQGNGQPVVAGSVTSVSGSTFSISNSAGASFTIDASNATIRGKGNATTTVSSIAVGDRVLVQGTVNGSSITASTVFDQGSQPANNGTSTKSDNGKGNGGIPGMGGFFGKIGNMFKHLFGF